MLKIHNSLTKKKEIFTPLNPPKVNLYVCGITVYDRCHLGHARSMVCFDVIVRFLKASGYKVNFVRNITDIDDKIIRRAKELNISIDALTEQNIKDMHEDTKLLGLLKPNSEPKATLYVDEMIALIKQLVTKNLAYVSESGDVCFEVERFKPYGKLSHQDLDGLLAGARVEVGEHKRSPLDFVLWKKSKEGEPSWSSPWGDGRPGWHIECSAMSTALLGPRLDIHGGGVDLQFPHHENEIAQSEGASGEEFAKYWMHVGLLHINEEKMAKSTGNFLTIDEVLHRNPPEVVRYFLLSCHYRSVLHYSLDAIKQAHKSLVRLYQALKDVNTDAKIDKSWVAKFFSFMNDDFNTPGALSVLFELSHELNRAKSPSIAATLKYLAGLLGILQSSATDLLQMEHAELSKEEIEELIKQREAARKAKNWSLSDEIRQTLQAKGIILEDNQDSTTWRKEL
ncbi:MAG: cysteine--tRNA ligase [Legionellales bacterium RIFCSPHIGHO2_12_FULL_37_14]|nr:MAG: cysteine--tRNA ligase [Legionellales bacterium RIFCSPHIGHO2_12_FULL_37_14]